MDKVYILGHEKIGKLITKFSVPAIIGMLVMASYNIVDRIFVGRGVGTLAISGIAVTFPLLVILMGFGLLVGIGATSIISIRLGEKRFDEAEKTLGNAFTMSLVISTILVAIGYLFMDPMLSAFGGTGQVLEYAKEYSHIFFIGVVFQGMAFSLNNIIRGEGHPKIAMYTMMISAGINAALNPVFIFGMHMGIRGSALATVIAQCISAFWVVGHFLGKRSTLKLKLANLKPDKKILIPMLSIGSSPFLMQVAGGAITVIFNKTLLAYGGDLAIAAMGVGNSIMMLIMMPIFGINQGVQPIIGYNYGAKQYDRVLEAFKVAIYIATGICILGFIAVQFFSEGIVGMFSKNDMALVSMGAHGMRVFMMMLPIGGFQIISWAYFQAVGKPKQALILTMTKQILLLIPLVMILPHYWGLDGVWYTGPIADSISALVAITLLTFEMRRLKALKTSVTEPGIELNNLQPEFVD